jgi:hypothetical protein
VNKLISFFIFFLFFFSLKSQSSHNIEIIFDSTNNKFSVKQIIIINDSIFNNNLDLYLYDWNNAYSSFNSILSKKLYSEYDSSLLKPQSNLVGRTEIKNILINDSDVSWVRLEKNIDIIKIEKKNLCKKQKLHDYT